MKTMKGLTILAAFALTALMSAGARAQGSNLQGGVDLNVKNNDLPAPTSCAICGGGGCSPTNMRDTGGVTTINSATDQGATVTVGQRYCGDGGQWECDGISWGGTCYSGFTQNGDGSYSGGSGVWSGCMEAGAAYSNTTGANGGQSRFSAYAGTGYYLYTANCANAGGSLPSATVFINKLHCFPAGTPILMCDGTEKAIEKVQKGECVESYNVDTGQFVKSSVNSTVTAEAHSLYEITTAEGTLKITPMHQMYVNGKWAESDDVKPGDKLIDANGNPVTVTSVETVTETIEVYDLITDQPHDFFASNILVHNTDPGAEHKGHGFAAGTKIALADGRLVPIEKVKPGDKLISYDNVRGRWHISVVRGTGKQKVSQYRMINKKLRMGLAQPLLLAQLPAKKADTK